MLRYREKWTLPQAVLVSLALHGSLLLLVWLLQWHAPQRQRTDKLLVELYGLVADRQSEARAPAPAAARQPPPQKAAPQHAPKTPPPEKKYAFAPLSPVQVAEPDKLPTQTPTPQVTGGASAPPADAPQKQTTLKVQDNIDALKQYLARIKKKLRANLVYPDDAKKRGYEGTTVLRFAITESGTIRPGSLVVVQSSGQATLDANARQAALASEPFDRPSREIVADFEMPFSLKN